MCRLLHGVKHTKRKKRGADTIARSTLRGLRIAYLCERATQKPTRLCITPMDTDTSRSLCRRIQEYISMNIYRCFILTEIKEVAKFRRVRIKR